MLQPVNSFKQLNLHLPYYTLVDLSHWQILFQVCLSVAFSLSSFLSTIFCLVLDYIVAASPYPTWKLVRSIPCMPFDTFGLQRACGWRMNEYQGNIVLVCVGCGVGSQSVLRHLLYCFFNLAIRVWNKNKMLILAEMCCWMNRK